MYRWQKLLGASLRPMPRAILRSAVQVLVLHELTTNAAKYGAFSRPSGRVRLKWWRMQNGGQPHLAIDWEEIGGPVVVAPRRAGYGTCVVRELVPFELGGTVDLAFAADGLRCRLEIPGDWISTASPAIMTIQELNPPSDRPMISGSPSSPFAAGPTTPRTPGDPEPVPANEPPPYLRKLGYL